MYVDLACTYMAFSSPELSSGRAIALPLASALASVLNPVINLNYILSDVRY